MRSRTKVFKFLSLALLATGVLALPLATAAATPKAADGARTAPPALNLSYNGDVFGTLEAPAGAVTSGPQRFSRLAVRLYGGYNYIAAGDVNDGTDGYFELMEAYAASGYGTTTGGYNPVHAGYNFGADFVYQITPVFGVGIGAGYMRSSKDSLMTLTSEMSTITLTATPTLSAVPIRLGVFLNFPVAGKIDLTANAGATYYAGLTLNATQRLEFTADDWTNMAMAAKRSSLSANLGFQGSLGVEYKLSPRMGFFIEAVGRYARLKNFDIVTGTTTSSGGSPSTSTGKLYIVTYSSTDLTYSAFTIEDTVPVDNPPAETYREPKIDLSGFSLQAGIRIRL